MPSTHPNSHCIRAQKFLLKTGNESFFIGHVSYTVNNKLTCGDYKRCCHVQLSVVVFVFFSTHYFYRMTAGGLLSGLLFLPTCLIKSAVSVWLWRH